MLRVSIVLPLRVYTTVTMPNGKPCCIPKCSVPIMKSVVGAEGEIVWEHVF